MSKFRKSNSRTDLKQDAIVEALEDIPNLTVCKGHDDILLGFNNRTMWYEVKNPERLRKDGSMPDKTLRYSQKKLKKKWQGHYKVVTCLDDILRDLNIIK